MKAHTVVTELPLSCSKCLFYTSHYQCVGNNDYATLEGCKLGYINYNDHTEEGKVHKKCKLTLNTSIKLK